MALSKDYIGKKCYIDMEDNPNIDKSMLGTIINYYSDGSDTYVEISMNPYGEVIKVRDDSLITLIDSGSGGGGGGGGGSTPPYPPLPSDYQELEYLETNAGNGHPYVVVNAITAGDYIRVNFLGDGVILGSRVNSWNMNIACSNKSYTTYYCGKIFVSWELITQDVDTWSSFQIQNNYSVSFNYGRWDGSYLYNGKLGILTVERWGSPKGTYDDIQPVKVVALIPCYRKADDVNGFYDTVNDIFYTSPTGTFTRGPEKN